MSGDEQVKKPSAELQQLKDLVATLQVHDAGTVTEHRRTNKSMPTVQRFNFDKSEWSLWIAHYER